MKTSRFTKGQKIYQVEIHNDIAIRVWEKVVLSCGQKILKLQGKWNNEDYRINTYKETFSLMGEIGNLIERFHETKEDAIREMNLFNSRK